jgi:hypothetical protein
MTKPCDCQFPGFSWGRVVGVWFQLYAFTDTTSITNGNSLAPVGAQARGGNPLADHAGNVEGVGRQQHDQIGRGDNMHFERVGRLGADDSTARNGVFAAPRYYSLYVWSQIKICPLCPAPRHSLALIIWVAALVSSPASAQDQPAATTDRGSSAVTTLPSQPTERQTAKERLSEKWTDEQRVDNCKVPIDKRGPKPRPDCPAVFERAVRARQ